MRTKRLIGSQKLDNLREVYVGNASAGSVGIQALQIVLTNQKNNNSTGQNKYLGVLDLSGNPLGI